MACHVHVGTVWLEAGHLNERRYEVDGTLRESVAGARSQKDDSADGRDHSTAKRKGRSALSSCRQSRRQYHDTALTSLTCPRANELTTPRSRLRRRPLEA